MRVNRAYPTIVGWTAELARKRIREENKSGAFGRGTVIPRIAKPAVVAATTSGQNVEPPVAAESTVNVPPLSADRVAGVLQKLASIVAEFRVVMADIGKQGAPVNVMKKTFSGIFNMLNVASTMEALSTPTASQLDDIFYGSETFTTVVDALVEAFETTRKQMDPDGPSFDLGLSQTPQPSHQEDVPSFDLGLTPTPSPPQQQEKEKELDIEVAVEQPGIDALVDRIAMDAGVSSSPEDVVSTPGLVRVPFGRVDSPVANQDDFDRE